MFTKKLMTIAVIALALTACATDDPNRRGKTGAAIGALAGAVLGHQAHSDRGKFVGAAIGALAGAAVGQYMDKQQAELDRQLAQEQRDNEIELVRIDEETLKLNLNSGVTFDVDSASLKAGFYDSLSKVAKTLSQYDKTAVHIVGHTDSTGSSAYNQRLSERRAQSVGRYLGSHGVNNDRTRLLGRGESDPRANNSSDHGRQQNRRVEIFLKSIVEGREEEAFRSI